MNRLSGFVTAPVFLALVLVACGSGPDNGDRGSEGTIWNPDSFADAEYQTEWTPEGLVRLENGEYRAQAAPGSASEIVVALTDHMAFGESTNGRIARHLANGVALHCY